MNILTWWRFGLLSGLVVMISFTSARAQSYSTGWVLFEDVIQNDDNTLSRVEGTGTGWTAGALASNTLPANTDGSISFTAGSGCYFMVGFTTSVSTFGYTGYTSSFMLNTNGNVSMYEGSTGVTPTTYASGDVFMIKREGAYFYYYQNDSLLRTVDADASEELYLKISIITGTPPLITASFDAEIYPKATVIGTGITDGTGHIVLDVVGGAPPYTYTWSNNETTAEISNLNRGSYTVEIKDADNRTVTKTYTVGYQPGWTDLSYVTDSLGILTATATNHWLSGANSTTMINSGADGWMEFTIDQVENIDYVLGWATRKEQDTSTPYYFKYGLRIVSGTVSGACSLISGTGTAYRGTWQVGDVFRLERSGDMIYCKQNGEVIYSTSTNTALELFTKATLYTQGSTPAVNCSIDAQVLADATTTATTVSDPNSGGVAISPYGGTVPYTYQWSTGDTDSLIVNQPNGTYSVTVTDAEGRTFDRTYMIGYKPYWTELTGVIDDDGVLVRDDSNSGSGWANGALTSNEILPNTNGRVDFIASDDLTAYYEIGIATDWTFTTNGHNTFATGVMISGANATYSIRYSTYTISSGSYKNGDVFSFQREDDSLRCFRNSELLYTRYLNPAHTVFVKAVNYNGYTDAIPMPVTSFAPQLKLDVSISYPDSLNGTGRITAKPYGGVESYAFDWGASGEQTAEITDKTRDAYTVTVGDQEGRSLSRTYQIGYSPQWTKLTNVTDEDGALVVEESASGTWGNGAFSGTRLPEYSDGWLEFVTDSTVSYYLIGFANNELFESNAYNSFVGAFRIVGGQSYSVYVGSSVVGTGLLRKGTVFNLARVADSLVYTVNGEIVYKSAINAAMGPGVKVVAAIGRTPAVTTSFDTRLSADVVVKSAMDDTGSISVSPSGGTAPYQYEWSTGETDSLITNKAHGSYTVTITDAEQRTYTRTYTLAYPVLFTELTGVVEEDGNLVKEPASDAWDAGANSLSELPANTDGWFEFVAADSNTCMIGWGSNLARFSYSYLSYAWYSNAEFYLRAYEGGTVIALGGYAKGDVFRLGREGDSVVYYLNGEVRRKVAVDASVPLYVKTSVYRNSVPHITASFQAPLTVIAHVNGTSSGASADGEFDVTVAGGRAPYQYSWSSGETTDAISQKARDTYQLTVTDNLDSTYDQTYRMGYKVEWGDLINTAVEDNRLVKTTSTNTWDGGAVSVNYLLPNEDGWLQFVIESKNIQHIVGFSDYDPSIGYASVKYSLLVGSAGVIQVRQSGTMIKQIDSYDRGDVCRISREGDYIRYYVNDEQIYQASTSSADTLWIDASVQINKMDPVVASFTSPGQTFYAIASGDWNDTSIWSLTENGDPAGRYPDANDEVIIKKYDIAISAAASCADMYITAVNTVGGVSIDGSASSLQVHGKVVISGGSSAKGLVVKNGGSIEVVEP